MQNSWQRDCLWLFFAVLSFYCIGLGVMPYLTPSEARYIEVPRQMLATDDWLTPRINGVPYFEKPPLFYWMQASVLKFFGTGEFAGRIATALLATLTCMITYATGRALYARLSGLLAATVIATCMLGYTLSRVSMLDMPVSLFLTACFSCFIAAQHTGKRAWYWGMYAAAALAVMTKGLIGIVVPGMVIGAWIALTSRWRILKEAKLFSGLLLFLAVAAPWHVLMAQKHAAFLDFYFINEHFTRYLTDSHKRVQPWWFFIVITIAGLLPWTFLIPAIYKEHKAKLRLHANEKFLLLWIFIPLVFFSASHSKLAPYIFPIFPPLSILIGHYLASCWEGHTMPKVLRINGLIAAGIFAAIIAVYCFVPLPLNEDNKLDFAASIPFATLAPVVVAIAGLAVVIVSKRSARVLIIALAIFAAVIDISANYIVAAVNHATVKPLIADLKKQLHDDDTVSSFGTYFQDLPIYLNRNVVVGDYTGELEFGYAHYPETHGWMLTAAQFWQRCASEKHPFYVFMKNETYKGITIPAKCQLRIVAKYGKTMLLEKEAK
jgi:4-amino-4-deoxy-L-arabinose transferase-like glycosyltransferase